MAAKKAKGDATDADAAIRRLEDELAYVGSNLQASIEQFEASNEEVRAANEEATSINEELQSTNEELKTSKEELQLLNEELTRVNIQLAAKVDELETKHADLENLTAATQVPTVCLDNGLTVRWFTPAAQQVIRLKPTKDRVAFVFALPEVTDDWQPTNDGMFGGSSGGRVKITDAQTIQFYGTLSLVSNTPSA